MKTSIAQISKSLKAVRTITWYAIRMFYRDKAAIFFSLFIPLMIMSIFGILNFEGTVEFNLGLVKSKETPVNQGIEKAFSNIEVINLKTGTYNDEIKALEAGEREMVVVLPETQPEITPLGEVKKQLEVEIYYNETQNPASRQTNLTIVNQVLSSVNDQITKAPKLFTFQEKAIGARKLTAVDYLIPGILAMSLMQMNLFGVIGGIVSWREKGILKRLLATPVRPLVIIFSQVFTRLTISLSQSALLLALGIYAFGMHLYGSLFLTLFIALLGGTIFLNIGFAVSGVSNTQNTVVAVANLIMMPQMFLSGVFFQRTALPDVVAKATDFLPLTYLADGMRAVMIDGASVSGISTQLYGLLIWVVVSFFLAVKFFRWE